MAFNPLTDHAPFVKLHMGRPRTSIISRLRYLSDRGFHPVLWQLTRSAFEAPGLEGQSGAAPPSESSDDDSDTTSSSMSQSGSGSGGSVVPMVLGDGPAHERVRGHHTFMRTLSL